MGGPFTRHARELINNGYSPIPIKPGSKRPHINTGWDELKTQHCTEEEIDWIAANQPDDGLGVAGSFGGLVPIDIDTDDENIIAAARAVLPEPMVGKTGKQGVTWFYRSADDIPALKLRMPGAKKPFLEVLFTGQSVIPPTVHPDTGKPYRWTTVATLLDTPAGDLPEITAADIKALQEGLAPWTRRKPGEHVPTLPTPTNDEAERARDALRRVPSDDYDTWIRVGHALKAGLGDAGLLVWREWSAKSDTFKAREIDKRWESFTDIRADLGTVIGIAQDHGWRDPRATVELKKGGKPLALEAAKGDKLTAEPEKPKVDWRSGLVTATALMRMEFKPPSYVIPGMLAEGLTVLAGRPKLGKSWWVLDLCIAVAGDLFVMNSIRPAVSGDVLYLALEDNQRRLQNRLRKLLAKAKVPARLSFHTEWPRANAGGLEALREWLAEHPETKLIVIDTLAKFRPPRRGKDAYEEDYGAVEGLQKLAGEFGIAILVLHHTRKAAADDPFDEVSGTLGLTGGADAILVLRRDSSGVVTLHGKGREIEEFEKAVQFDKTTCIWRMLGDAEEHKKTKQRRTIEDAIREANEPIGPKDIAAACGMKDNNVKQHLRRMLAEGKVEKVDKGKYVLTSRST